MEYPTLKVKQKSRQMADAFLGYNHNLRIGDTEFFDMKNMTSDYYPVLAPRNRRGVYKDGINATGIIAKEKLCYVDGSDFVIGDERIDMDLNDEPKTLISMGAYVIIMPDRKYINTKKVEDWDEIDEVHETTENVTFALCTLTGDEYGDLRPGEKPAEEDGNVWFDTSTTPPTLKKYSETNERWVTIATTYVKISSTGIGKNLKQYDGVELSGITAKGWEHLNGSHALWGCKDDAIIITGITQADNDEELEYSSSNRITVSRKIPIMDYMVESNNRLWGCRYGANEKGEVVNEIYASKLGDFKNWDCFMNLSTDSYKVSCGTDGPFTGAITHLGFPLFFKENCVHKVYGDYPANFRVQNTACRGVQRGSHRSLAIVNETLFYKSGGAVCAYDGSLPVEMSTALGEVRYSDAIAGAHGNKYYITMKSADGEYHLFVYDTAKGMWHKEDNLQVDAFCPFLNEMYGIDHVTKHIITMLGTGTQESGKVPWMVETGLVGMSTPDMKYISKLLIRMSLETGASVDVSIQYDSIGDWEKVCQMKMTSLRSFYVPVRPRRCDHFRIRIQGEGEGRIYSITKTIEQGSDVS